MKSFPNNEFKNDFLFLIFFTKVNRFQKGHWNEK